jgi:hypothetical protein
MQVDYAGNDALSRPLKDALSRVLAMSLIHEKMYRSETVADLDFGAYIELLAAQLLTAYCVDPTRVKLELNVEPLYFNLHEAIPCGLILNELVSNSLKRSAMIARASSGFHSARPTPEVSNSQSRTTESGCRAISESTRGSRSVCRSLMRCGISFGPSVSGQAKEARRSGWCGNPVHRGSRRRSLLTKPHLRPPQQRYPDKAPNHKLAAAIFQPESAAVDQAGVGIEYVPVAVFTAVFAHVAHHDHADNALILPVVRTPFADFIRLFGVEARLHLAKNRAVLLIQPDQPPRFVGIVVDGPPHSLGGGIESARREARQQYNEK